MASENSVKNPGAESLIFKPAKVSWIINSYLLKQNNRRLKWFVYLIILANASFIFWAYTNEKAIVVDATGEIISKSPPLPVTSKVAMTVKTIRVKNNQAVKKNEIILTSTRDLNPEDQKALQNTLDTMSKRVALEKIGQCDEACLTSLRFISEQGFSKISRLESGSELSRSLTELSRYFKDYVNQLSLNKDLPSTTASIRYEIATTQKKMNEIKKRNAEKILAIEYDQLSSRRVSLTSQLNERSLSTRSALNSARNLIELSIDSVTPTLKSYSADSTVRAPSDGIVSLADLKGEGQIIGPNQILLFLTAETSELGLKLKVPDSDIAKIKKGQIAKLDLSSFPASEYGVQQATISYIPEKITRDGNDVQNSFEVYGNLQRQGVLFQDQLQQFRAGMTLKAKVIVKHETMLTYYVKKLLSIKDSLLGGP